MKHTCVFVMVILTACAARADINQGLVANWIFDGGTLDDYSSYSHKGYSVGDVASASGVKGEALALSGDNYVEVPNVEALPVDDGSQSLSVSVWLNYQGGWTVTAVPSWLP